jgi:hypothetical protein
MYKYTSSSPWTFSNRKDPEEFVKRLDSLKYCVGSYASLNMNKSTYVDDLKRTDINLTCKKQMDAVKEFINRTGAGYENIYSAITPEMVKVIKNTEL